MKNKHQEIDRQLSLGLEEQSNQSHNIIARSQDVDSAAKILAFPLKKHQEKSFRERVREDLVRNRVIIE